MFLILIRLRQPSPIPIRATSEMSWFKKGLRNNYIFFDKSNTGEYGNLSGRGVGKVLAIFEVLHETLESWFQLCYIAEFQPLAGGIAQQSSGLIRVIEIKAADTTQFVPAVQRRLIDLLRVQRLAYLIPLGVETETTSGSSRSRIFCKFLYRSLRVSSSFWLLTTFSGWFHVYHSC